MSGEDTWEVYAVQYAHRPDRLPLRDVHHERVDRPPP